MDKIQMKYYNKIENDKLIIIVCKNHT